LGFSPNRWRFLEIRFNTRHELALEMLRHHRQELHYRWVAGPSRTPPLTAPSHPAAPRSASSSAPPSSSCPHAGRELSEAAPRRRRVAMSPCDRGPMCWTARPTGTAKAAPCLSVQELRVRAVRTSVSVSLNGSKRETPRNRTSPSLRGMSLPPSDALRDTFPAPHVGLYDFNFRDDKLGVPR
jgi:hypothetical protein